MSALLVVAATVCLPVWAQRHIRRFPSGKYPRLGSLELLPELQCFFLSNGTSPLASLNGKPLARGNLTCVAPVVDVGDVVNAEEKTTVDERRSQWMITGNPSTPQRIRSLAADAFNSQLASQSWFLPPVLDSAGRSTGDFDAVRGRSAQSKDKYRALLIDLLTLQRNTVGGEVMRTSGKYEVLSVTSVTRAVCLRPNCADLTAVDTTGPGACSSTSCDNLVEGVLPQTEDAVSVVTHTEKGGHTTPVSAIQRSFLGLGRAVMVQGGWLPSTTWNLTASLRTQLSTYPMRAPSMLSGDKSGSSAWPLGASTGASDWLSKVAFVLCQEPVPKYLYKKLLCKGIAMEDPVEDEVRYDKKSFRLNQSNKKGASASWVTIPAAGERSSAKNCSGAFNLTAPGPTEPMWLAGTASREIHARSPEEKDLAARLDLCSVPVHENRNEWKLEVQESYARYHEISRVEDILEAGSYAGLQPPDDAFSRSEAFFTGMLVALTAIGAATFVPNDAKWSDNRDRARFLLTATVGFGSVASFGLLYWKERKGDQWITSTTHKSLHVAFSNTTHECLDDTMNCDTAENGLKGSYVVLSETFSVVSTNGYRPLKILLLGCGAAALYAVIVGLIFCMKVARSRAKFSNESEPAKMQTGIDDSQEQAPGEGDCGKPWTLDIHAKAAKDPLLSSCFAGSGAQKPGSPGTRRAFSCFQPRSAPPPSAHTTCVRPKGDSSPTSPSSATREGPVRANSDCLAWRSSTGSPRLPFTRSSRGP